MRALSLLWLIASCGPGDGPQDYPPPPLHDLGLHDAPTYVARHLTLPHGILLAHPRLGQPAIRRAGEVLDVGWIAPGKGADATISIDVPARDREHGTKVTGACDVDGICHAAIPAPALPVGLHAVCVHVGLATDCSPSALAVVDVHPDPLTVVHLSDAHIGDGDSLALFTRAIDAINALSPPPDAVMFTGDGADAGLAEQHADFVAQLTRLHVPVFAVTGNHDYDATGVDGWLLAVGPELDYQAVLGGLRLVGVSTGQDLDDGKHNNTLSVSSGPDPSQLAWLGQVLVPGSPPTIVFEHHPIYNGLFATVGPESRDQLKALVTQDFVRAVLCGHTHISAVFDADGDSRGLSLDADVVARERWPLHYVASRSTRAPGGFAILHVGTDRVDYRWVDL